MPTDEIDRVTTRLFIAGICYYKGGLYDKAIACWKTLVDNCDDISNKLRINAEYFLGRVYFDGDVVPQDRSELERENSSTKKTSHCYEVLLVHDKNFKMKRYITIESRW